MRYIHRDYSAGIYIDSKRYIPLHKINALLHNLYYFNKPLSSEVTTADILIDNYITVLDMYNLDDFSVMRKNIINNNVKRTAQYFINYSHKSPEKLRVRDVLTRKFSWQYYVMDKDVYILFYHDYLIKVDFKKKNISLLGVLAMDCEFISEKMQKVNFFNRDNPIVDLFHTKEPEEINPSIGLFLEYDFYEYYMTSKRRGAYMIRAINSFTESNILLHNAYFNTNVYPVNNLNALILKNFKYKKLSNSIKAQNPTINEYDIVTNLHLAFQNKASVDFITNEFNKLFNG